MRERISKVWPESKIAHPSSTVDYNSFLAFNYTDGLMDAGADIKKAPSEKTGRGIFAAGAGQGPLLIVLKIKRRE